MPTDCRLLCTEVLPERAALRWGRLLPDRQAVQRGECDAYISCCLQHVAHICVTSTSIGVVLGACSSSALTWLAVSVLRRNAARLGSSASGGAALQAAR
jgi:hypothetical protein